MISSHITGIIIVLGTSVILPITIVFLILRKKTESEKNRKEIILAALEKNADINIEDLVKKMNKPEKLIKEKLLVKLESGCLLSLMGLGLVGYGLWLDYAGGSNPTWLRGMYIGGACMIAIGIANLITYFAGKKSLAKEMEAEEQNMKQN